MTRRSFWLRVVLHIHWIFSASCLNPQTWKCHPSRQTQYSLINNALLSPPLPPPFHFTSTGRGWRRLHVCFVFRCSFFLMLPLKKARERASCGNTVGQQWPWNHSEWSCLWENGEGAVQTTCWGNQLTHFHPISTAECVHFQANGMSFCRSLWSRINPGIKTDFPGSNLPSSIDFFTLTTSVLPNLTWQPAAQWTGSTLAPHRGSSPPPPPPPHKVKERFGKRLE